MNKILILGLFSLIFLFQSNTFADKLLLEAISNEPPNSIEGVPRPKPGMLDKRVKKIFGKPKKISDPVGFPAITRWQYEKFEVIFEGHHVINTVLKTPGEMFVSDQ